MQDHAHCCIDRIVTTEERVAAMARRASLSGRRSRQLARAATPMAPRPARMALVGEKLWDAGDVLRIRFLDGDPDVQVRVANCARQWVDHANLAFEFGTSPDAELRVSFQERGSWSYIGTDALLIDGNRATMNYGWLDASTGDEELTRVVLHEFGHSLGCIHEHQNPAGNIPWDRDAVYAYYGGAPNYWSRDQVDQNLFRKYDVEQTRFTELDLESIMLYPIPTEHTVGDFEVGSNGELSERDQEFIATIYPGRVPTQQGLVLDGGPLEAGIGSHGEVDTYVVGVPEYGVYTFLTEGPSDVVMSLFGPDDLGQLVGEDDDSGPGLNASITRALEPGTYEVQVRHYWSDRTGKYRISFSEGA